MLILSEILIQNHQLTLYKELIDVIKKRANEGEVFFDIDVKPPFLDTPENWEEDLEIQFTSAR
ncbi:MAG: sulfur relay protein DsrC [Gammaproteobacteria bacterium]|nr:sulfur relay protein DsrC [Gammaproteobacteria bacterium]